MKQIILNGKTFKTIDDLHRTLKIKLELPEDYGSNLDALWDCLTGYVEIPIIIKWISFSESEKTLGEYARKVRDLFQEVGQEIEGFKFEVTSDV
jgi:ribonuclease inhibitor